jgi:hypothetical protein
MAKTAHHFAGLGLLAFGLVAQPAFARTEVTPYLELDQTVTAELRGGNDVLTYSSAIAGVDVSVDSGRTKAQLSYQYEHRFAWDDNVADDSVHTGLARVTHELVSNKLDIEAGALATRARSDNRGAAPSLLVGNVSNVSQVYSVYGGPTYHDKVGAVDVNAGYRAGYTKVEDKGYVATPGQPNVDGYDDSVSHLAMASVGMEAGQLPFGWSVSGAWEREDAGQLDQRFESRGVRGDVVVPVTPTVAVVGGVGYEDIKASERAPLFDGTGNPIVDGNGRFTTNSASPRLASYDFDGLYWDVGAEWKPSDRTSLGVHVGRRYGSMSYTGAFAWNMDQNSSLQIGVYDQVETFGQQLSDGLARLPTSFNTGRNNLAPQFGGCVFGSGGGSGGCLSSAFQGVSSSVYRTRGVSGMYNYSRNRLSLGAGLGYAIRDYKTPVIAGAFTLDGIRDKAFYGQANMGYALTRNSGLDSSGYVSLSKSGIAGAPDVLSAGATTGYFYNFGRNLSARASMGLYSFDVDGLDPELNASGQVGVRYSF